MKIAVIGMWHLGTVISSGLSFLKKNIIYCFDEKEVIDKFRRKKLPITEKNIQNLINSNHGKNIFFSDNFEKLKEFDVIWITYDTKIKNNDTTNFKDIFDKLKFIINNLKKKTRVIISSQIPVGSIKKLENYDKLYTKKKLSFIYIPENLRLGKSLDIFLKSKDMIIGIRNPKDKKLISNVIKGLNLKKHFVSVETAEMTKHMINTYLACSISLVNEVSSIAKKYNVSFDNLEKCVKTDNRISKNAYLRPGNSFSGGTLARDVNYLVKESQKLSSQNLLLRSILKSNSNHSKWVERLVHSQKNLKNKNILQIGLSYTSGTTTLRKSLPYKIFQRLKKKSKIKVYDNYLLKNSNEIDKIKKYFISDKINKKFDIIIVFNKDNDFKTLKKFINKNTLIIDINNFYKKDCLKNKFNYHSLEYGF